MRILLTGNTAFVIANFRAGLIRALIAEGHAVAALVPEDDDCDTLRRMGCQVIPLRMSTLGTNPIGEARGLVSVLLGIRRADPDVVLSFTIKNNLYGAIAARLLGVPLLPNVTGLGTSFSDRGLLNWTVVRLYRQGLRRLPVVFFQNRDDAAWLARLGIVEDAQVRLLPGSGVDLGAFHPVPLPGRRENPTFLLVARMLWDKGIGEFAEAARAIRARHPEARFQLLGRVDPAQRSAVPEAELGRWAAEGLVEYLGSVADVRPVIAAADCVVLPSYYREGTPRVLLEGSAMGRPIVTTDMPGCRDVVEDGVTGYLCRPRDAADLARCLSAIAGLDPSERTAMGLASRRRMEAAFDERVVIAAYIEAIGGLTRPHAHDLLDPVRP
jgi:glycosyltransferase involved in cell wall biosynthesis